MIKKSIDSFIDAGLVIKNIDDINFLNEYSKKDISSKINEMQILFNESSIFKYGDYARIGSVFKKAIVNKMSIEQIEELMQNEKTYKGIPIRIDLDNIGELPIEKLNKVQNIFDIDSIKIWEKSKRHGEAMLQIFDVNQYGQIREKVDSILKELYVPDFSRYDNVSKN